MPLLRNVLKDKTTRFDTWSGEVLYAPSLTHGHPVMDTLSKRRSFGVSLCTEMCKQRYPKVLVVILSLDQNLL